MNELVIRGADRDDVPALVELLGLLFAQEAEFTPNAAHQRRALHALIRDPDRAVVLVAAHQRKIVGCLTLQRSLSTVTGGHVCWMEDVIVHPDHRGLGLGSTLIRAAITEARRREWSRITLLTDHDNTAAQAMYTAAGYARSDMIVLRRSTADPDAE